MARLTGTAMASASPTLKQYINLDDYVYTSGLTAPNPQLASRLHLEPLVNDGQDVEEFNSATGFYGEAFVTTGRSHDLVVAFQGTNPNPPNDVYAAAQVADDLQIYLGQTAPSYGSALAFTQEAMADAANQGISASHVYLTGHSLGAADAEYVASQTGLAGVTFGTPGIVATGAPASRLHNYVEQGDPVGNYASNAPDYLGDIVSSSAIRHYGATTLVGSRLHSNLLTLARSAYDRGGDVGTAAAAGLLGTAADLYHPLGTYAGDLGLKLYSEDFSAGADTGFFDLPSTFAAEAAAAPLCFAAGTRIRTARGDIAVEQLVVGDLAATTSGQLLPIRWLGRREVDGATCTLPYWPVRIRAGAFGAGLPERELRLSPGHPVLVCCGDVEVLVPIMCLINGTTVYRTPVEAVTYWHVELVRHDILLAEGLGAESFLDIGNRPWFGLDDQRSAADHALLDPDSIPPGLGGRCRPVVLDGPIVEAERRRLDTVFATGLAEAGRWPDASCNSLAL